VSSSGPSCARPGGGGRYPVSHRPAGRTVLRCLPCRWIQWVNLGDSELLQQRLGLLTPRRTTGQRFRTHEVGPCQGREGSALPGGLWVGWLLVSAVDAGRSRGQGGAPRWTNDLAGGKVVRRIMRREPPVDVAEKVSHAPIRAPSVGPHDGESGPGLRSQVNGGVAGACENASAPGDGLLRWCCLQLLEDVEAAGQQPAGDRGGGDVVAAAVGQLA
jgi:hypothetical protein